MNVIEDVKLMNINECPSKTVRGVKGDDLKRWI